MTDTQDKTKEAPIKWLSQADMLSDDFVDDYESKSHLFTVDVFVQNPNNRRTLDDLKKDKDAMQLLANLQKTNAMEIEVYEDDRHQSFNIEMFFESEEDAEACATTYGTRIYGTPTGGICRQVTFTKAVGNG